MDMKQFLSKFRGGVHLPLRKQNSLQAPIRKIIPKDTLIIPLHQHIGSDAKCIVEPGQTVLKGQTLAKADGYISASIHAPTSGKITDISERPVPHPSGLKATCIGLLPDGEDRWIERQPVKDYQSLNPSSLRNLIRDAGIVGLGGAGFPSFVKLNPRPNHKVDTLILNGSECEPYISCDEKLMIESANDIILGVEIILHAIQAEKCIVAIEDSKTEAIESMHSAAKESNLPITVQAIPTIYPAGSEKQLIETITGRQVPSEGLPAQIGVILQNVGTAAAVHRAIHLGEPLIDRIITVAGNAIKKPGNFLVPFGTSIDELLAACESDEQQIAHLIMGGPMMGFKLHHSHVPVIKTTNCVIASSKNELTLYHQHRACIRCGKCAESCPINLLPQQLYWHAQAKNFEKDQKHYLFDCIECGCCSYVCPSKIPLVQYFRFAKMEIWAQERDKERSDIARQRHEARQMRLEREKAEKEAKRQQKKKELEKQKNQKPEQKSEDEKKDLIAAALARVEAKKAQKKQESKNSESTEKQE